MSFASKTPGTEVVRIATLPLRATRLPGAAAAALAFWSAVLGCMVEFDAIPARLLVEFMAPVAEEPAPAVAPVELDADPIAPLGTLEEDVASPYGAGGLLVPLITSEPIAGETD